MAEEPEVPEVDEMDTSHELDMVTVFESQSAGAEMEAMSIVGLLESNGLAPVLVGSSSLPNLPFVVQVPKEQVETAQARLAEAIASGAAGAEEAERATEEPT